MLNVPLTDISNDVEGPGVRANNSPGLPPGQGKRSFMFSARASIAISQGEHGFWACMTNFQGLLPLGIMEKVGSLCFNLKSGASIPI